MILEASKVVKNFGGLTAVNRVSLQVAEGEVIGLIGPNGAGKTTIFNLIVGIHKPSHGRIIFRNKEIQGLLPHQICLLYTSDAADE